jgi:hypothetical protein
MMQKTNSPTKHVVDNYYQQFNQTTTSNNEGDNYVFECWEFYLSVGAHPYVQFFNYLFIYFWVSSQT